MNVNTIKHLLHVGDVVKLNQAGYSYIGETIKTISKDDLFKIDSIKIGDVCEEGIEECTCNRFVTLKHLYKNITIENLMFDEVSIVDIVQNL